MPQEDPTVVMGIRFPNAVGLAAGMDVNADCVSAFGALGFGHIEVGPVCPTAQGVRTANDCVRIKLRQALVDATPSSSCGVEQTLRNLRSADCFHLRGGILGINIEKNSVTAVENCVNDYLFTFKQTYAKADYFCINLTSTEARTTHLLHSEPILTGLLSALRDERSRLISEHDQPYKPIAVKISPDLSDDQLLRLADTVHSLNMDSIVGTSASNDCSVIEGLSNNAGLLSGRPLSERTTHCVARLTEHLGSQLPVIASGGVMTPNDVVEKLQAGASLVQLYSGLVYQGPSLVAECVEAAAGWRREHAQI